MNTLRYPLFVATIFLALMALSASTPQEPVPLYKNPSAPTEKRVQDLLKRMTVEEKVGQLSTLLGWEMYDKQGATIQVSKKFEQAIQEQKVGALWATLRADPWTQKTLTNGLNPALAAQATNASSEVRHGAQPVGHSVAAGRRMSARSHGYRHNGISNGTRTGEHLEPGADRTNGHRHCAGARLQGAHIGYGPVLDLAREPRWSRVEETYGEDPVLTSQLGSAMVRGFQGKKPTKWYQHHIDA